MIQLRASEPVWYVSVHDEAVDLPEDFDAAGYVQSPHGKELPIKENSVPSKFQLKGLTSDQEEYVKSLPLEKRARERVAFGLLAVQGVKNPDGSEWNIRRKRSGDLGERVDREDMAKLYTATNLLMELSVVIDHLSQLHPL